LAGAGVSPEQGRTLGPPATFPQSLLLWVGARHIPQFAGHLLGRPGFLVAPLLLPILLPVSQPFPELLQALLAGRGRWQALLGQPLWSSSLTQRHDISPLLPVALRPPLASSPLLSCCLPVRANTVFHTTPRLGPPHRDLCKT
jgi:hypothetical protein